MKKLFVFLLLFCSTFGYAAEAPVVYPSNWYKGMKDSVLQLIVRYEGARDAKLNLKTNIVKVTKRYACNNVNYLMIDLVIPSSYLANYIPIELEMSKKKKILINYPLLDRPQSKKKTLEGRDLIYLIMPDRFANGNTNNDEFPELNEKEINRAEPFARHGGDLKGIEQNLDYIQGLGANTIWLTPFLENNEPKQSYHGYAITDHYKSDPRICSNEQYKYFVNTLHARKMKIVVDMVFNHIGDQHWIYKDAPFPNWIHRFDTFTKTNYRANTLMDPYASARDKKQFTNGWFDNHMPDLNLDDSALARYMIQNTLWWLLYADIDAIRIDTYSYPEYEFMQRWHKAIRQEFPDMSIFGEIWEHVVPLQSYFTPKDQSNAQAMQHVLDFQFCFAMQPFLNQDFGWTEGVSKMYYVLTQDYLYADPFHHVTFIDNHDLDRFLSSVGGDIQKLKSALGVLLTMRGIPCIFYGTEVLMKGKGNDGVKREDFSGGWKEDALNKFEIKNQSKDEQQVGNYIRNLQAWKIKHDGFSEGSKMMQFIPMDGLYMFARYSSNDAALMMYNSSKKPIKIDYKRFEEIAKGYSSGEEALSRKKVHLNEITVLPNEFLIVDLEK
jgi:glycosidase